MTSFSWKPKFTISGRMEKWSGRVAVVTGSDSGVGTAIVQHLTKEGLIVIGLDLRNESPYPGNTAGNLHNLKCDVTKEEQVKSTFQWVKKHFGKLDLLVNNAGASDSNTLLEGPASHWRRILDVNILGLCICTKEAINCMEELGIEDGHIININSVVGHTIPPVTFPVYMLSASKHAVTVLTEGLRRELLAKNSKIRITSISPGMVKTNILLATGIGPEVADELINSLPHMEPEDVTEALSFILGAPPKVEVHEVIIRPLGEIL